MNRISSSDWHSPLASSLPYISSVSSYSERGVIMSMGMSPIPYDERDELQYPFDDEIASSTEHIETDTETTGSGLGSERQMKPSRSHRYEITTNKQASYESTSKHIKQASITSTSSSSDDSDADIDEIRRAIDKTLGSKEDDDISQQNINPRAKYLAQLGIGKKLPLAWIIQKSSSSQTSSRTTPRTPPTSPVTDSNDDSLDAMLALMGVSDEMIAPVTRSSPIDIPRRVSRPISIPTRQSRPISRPIMPMIPQPSHKYDSDDDTESYFDSPQSEDLSGSMLFDY